MDIVLDQFNLFQKLAARLLFQQNLPELAGDLLVVENCLRLFLLQICWLWKIL